MHDLSEIFACVALLALQFTSTVGILVYRTIHRVMRGSYSLNYGTGMVPACVNPRIAHVFDCAVDRCS